MTQKTLKFVIALSFAAVLIAPIAHGQTPASAETTADIIAAATAATTTTNTTSISDLRAKIDDLQTQLEALSVNTTNISYNFTRDLFLGRRGNDVLALQQFLNAKGFAVAAAGPGSGGKETTYFGVRTKAALGKWQLSVGLNGFGHFGPISRGKVASLGASAAASVIASDLLPGCTSSDGFSPTTGVKCDLAQVTFSNAVALTTSDPGLGVNVWEGTATVASRDVNFTHLALRQMGSIGLSDIGNFRLWVDGNEVASQASLDPNGYVTFSGFKAILPAGARTLKVTADVTGGSGKTVQMSLRGSYDVMFTDNEMGVSRASAGTFPFGPEIFTVGKGTLTVVKAANSASEKLTRGEANVPLATYIFTAYGEPIRVETLNVGMVTNDPTNVTIRNVRILAGGVQVGGTTDVPAETAFEAGSGTQFIADFLVSAGASVRVEVRGDTIDSEGIDEIDGGSVTSIQAVLIGGTGNIPLETNVLGNILAI